MPGLESNGPPLVEGYLSEPPPIAESVIHQHASIPTPVPGFAVQDNYFTSPVALDSQRSLAQPP